MGNWTPVLAPEVRFEADGLRDEVAGLSLSLPTGGLELLRASNGRATLLELERAMPGAAALLLELNQAHLVNFSPGPCQRWVDSWRRLRTIGVRGPEVCERIALGDDSLRGVLLAVSRGVWSHILSSPMVTLAWSGVILVTGALTATAGPIMLGIALAAVIGFFLHEVGHACASLLCSSRVYVAASFRGVCVCANLPDALQARAFAAAGPLLPTILGTATLATAPFGDASPWLAGTLLAHAVHLVPPFHDGLVLLNGGPPKRLEKAPR
jgi:hypothetical protein